MKSSFAHALWILLALAGAPSTALAQIYNGPGHDSAVLRTDLSDRASAVQSGVVRRQAEPQGSGLGGGLIELLITGSTPGPSRLASTAASVQGQGSADGYPAPPFGPAPERARALAYAPLAAETYAHPRPVLSDPEPRISPPGSGVPRARGAGHDRHRHAREIPLPRRARRACHPLWHRRRSARLRMGGTSPSRARPNGRAGRRRPKC